MSKDSNWGGNLVFFLLGAATGAAVALLYAPQEGEATRRLIGEKAEDIKGRAGDYSNTAASTVKDKWGQVTDKAQELLNRSTNSAHDAIDQAAESAHATVNKAS